MAMRQYWSSRPMHRPTRLRTRTRSRALSNARRRWHVRRNGGNGPAGLDRGDQSAAVIPAGGRHERRSRPGQQGRRQGDAIALTAGEHEAHGTSPAIDRQSISVLSLPRERPRAASAPLFARHGLGMGPDDGAVDRPMPIVPFGRQGGEHALPDRACGPADKSLVHAPAGVLAWRQVTRSRA